MGHDLSSLFLWSLIPGEHQHIGIVVLPGHLASLGIPAQGRADPSEFVGRHAHAQSRPTDENAPVRPSRDHILTDQSRIVRVVHLLCFALTSQIPHLHPNRSEMLGQEGLERKPSMI
jgi:hypothetical protein